MRPERLRLLLRDLAASAAFGAMAVSGQVPGWAVFLFLLALGVAWRDDDRWPTGGRVPGCSWWWSSSSTRWWPRPSWTWWWRPAPPPPSSLPRGCWPGLLPAPIGR
jgi:hypothetical protein